MSARSRRRAPAIGTRERIVTLLRARPLTAAQLATELGITHTAVRGHLAALINQRIVAEASLHRSGGRPAVLYEVRPDAEHSLSAAYVPFTAQLMDVLRERTDANEMTEIMRAVGRRLARSLPKSHGPLAARVRHASAILTELGSINEIEARDHTFVIRAHGCVLGAAVHDQPDVCRALETLVSGLVDAPVRECCERGARPRCRFEIDVGIDVDAA